MAVDATDAIKTKHRKATAIRAVVTALVKSPQMPGASAAVQRLSDEATALGSFFSLPTELMLIDIAVVQAAAGR